MRVSKKMIKYRRCSGSKHLRYVISTYPRYLSIPLTLSLLNIVFEEALP